jgi:hypothetical protein
MDSNVFIDQQIIIDYIKLEMRRRKSINHSYSLRSFARDLKVNAGALSQILNNKRKISKKKSKHFIEKLSIDKKVVFQDGAKFEHVEIEDLDAISHWYYDAILELTKFREFSTNARWLSGMIGISKEEAQNAIKYLKHKKILKLDSKGKWVDGTTGFTTHINEGTSDAKKYYQNTILKKATESLYRDPISVRDHTSMMLSIKKERINEAKELLRKFRRDFCVRLDEAKDADCLYQLGLYFFPITKGDLNEEVD